MTPIAFASCIYRGHHSRELHKAGCLRYAVVTGGGSTAAVIDRAAGTTGAFLVRCTHRHRSLETLLACGRRMARDMVR